MPMLSANCVRVTVTGLLYLFLDKDLLDSYARDDEVGIGFRDMIPDHFGD